MVLFAVTNGSSINKTVASTRFFTHFFRRGSQIGSITPSSRFLAKKITQRIHFDRCDILVELGPGTGAFTTSLLEKMRPTSKLILIELNDVFFKTLQDSFQDPRITVVHGSATELKPILTQLGIAQADCIISSLPLAIFPKSVVNQLLTSAYDALKEEGCFVQFQYSLQYKKRIAKLYGNIHVAFTAINFPPAFVYTCTK